MTQTGTLSQPYAYTGREWDKETGLYYYRARYYDPMEGRFIQKDPIGFKGGDVNLYAYVQNNPINWIDPDGLRMTKGVLVTIRNWIKKNITPKGMTDEAVDKIVGFIGLRTLMDDILDPSELGEGLDDEYMIRNFIYPKKDICR